MRREVVTHGLTMIRVANLEEGILDPSEIGQFFDQDSYIVSWQYEARPVTKRLDGRVSQLPHVSRIKKVELFWHGVQSSTVDRGIAGLYVTKRVEEEGSQSLELRAGFEPALFVRLFNGRMMILKGRKVEGDFKTRMFIVLGEEFPECYALEVDVHPSSLRSRGVFILVTGRSKRCISAIFRRLIIC